jgi:protein-tyrosine-phosphatase
MAGGILRERLRARGVAAEVRTAGLYPGRALTHKTIAVMREVGIDVSTDYPKAVDSDLIAWADMVIPVDAAYGMELQARFPHVAHKLRHLGRDVADPVGHDLACYRATRDKLSALLDALVSTLAPTAADQG